MQNDVKNLGGIGASHVGSDDWQSKKTKHEKMKAYGNNSQVLNRVLFKPV